MLKEKASTFFNFYESEFVTIKTDLANFEVNWLQPAEYSLESYNTWIDKCCKSECLVKSDLIISDNNIVPLNVNGNVALMGSFLWPFIIDTNLSFIEEIVMMEKELLLSKRPKLICVDDMTPHNLNEYVETLRCPWIVEPVVRSGEFNVNAVLVTSGGTGFDRDYFANFAIQIKEMNPNLRVFVDFGIYMVLNGRLPLFDYQSLSFQKLKLIVARPGMGIISDAVRYSIPIVSFYSDVRNKELLYNSNRLTEMGIGMSFLINAENMKQIVREVTELLYDKDRLFTLKSNFSQRQIGGLSEAAEYIIKLI